MKTQYKSKNKYLKMYDGFEIWKKENNAKPFKIHRKTAHTQRKLKRLCAYVSIVRKHVLFIVSCMNGYRND